MLTSNSNSDNFESLDAKVIRENLSTQSHISETETTSHISKVKVAVVNCQSVPSKKSCYNNLVDYYVPHIVFGAESWLHPEISNSEIFSPDY